MKKLFKKLNSFLLALIMVFTFMPFKPAAAANDGSVNITILHTNDIHGRVMEGTNDGMGLAKLSSKVKEVKATNPNTLLLDAGDVLHGQPIVTISKGESMVKIMNTIAYDAMAPGNHDFNYGQDRLLELSKKADFPIISANIYKSDKTNLLTPYIIKELDGVKIGIFGLSTPATTYMTNPKNVEGLKFEDPTKVAKAMVDELKGKCDIIIALAHLGIDDNSEYTSKKVAENVEGIDLIVDGHSHSTLPEGLKVKNTLIVQTGDYDKNLGIVDIKYKDKKIADIKAHLFTKEEAKTLTEDGAIKAIVDGIVKDNEKITSVVVGKTEVKLDGERNNVRTKETNLGNLITDAMLNATGADAAMTNGGGIRASINVGEIKMDDVLKVLPFGNYVVLKEVKGSDIVGALENGVSAYPAELGGFPHVSGMTFKFNPKADIGSRIYEVKIGGKPIDPKKTYKLATNDFMASGGDKYTMLKSGKTLGEYPGLDEILATYIEKSGVKIVEGEPRIVAEEPPVVVKPTLPVEPQPKPEVEPTIYIVKPGDTLWKIGKMFKTTWDKLAQFNKIKNPNLIFPNQKILIPAN